MVQPMWNLKGEIPYKIITGNKPRKYEYTKFKWWWYVRYLDESIVDNSKDQLVIWIGVSHIIVKFVCYCVFTYHSIPVFRLWVIPIINME